MFYNTFANLNMNNFSCAPNNPFGAPNQCVSPGFPVFGSLTMPFMSNSIMPTSLFTPTISGLGFMNNSMNLFNFAMPSFNFAMPAFNFTMPSLQFNIPKIDTSNMDFSSSVVDTFTRTTPAKSDTVKKSSNDKIKAYDGKLTGSLSDYNAQKGAKLANTAQKGSAGRFTGHCARYVKTAISNAGLGAYKSGHGYQMTSVLAGNPNFKQISPDGVDVNKLPAGCVLVFNQGSQGYNPKYGHTEITKGDGTAVSDGVTHHIKKPDAIFIPV